MKFSTRPDRLASADGTVRTPAEHRYAVPGSSQSSGVPDFGLSAGPGGTEGDWLPSSVDTRNEGVRGSSPRVGLPARHPPQHAKPTPAGPKLLLEVDDASDPFSHNRRPGVGELCVAANGVLNRVVEVGVTVQRAKLSNDVLPEL